AAERQHLDQLLEIAAETLPEVRSPALAAAVPAHVDRDGPVALGQRRDRPIPAARVEPGGVHQQHSGVAAGAPFEIRQPYLAALKVVLRRLPVHVDSGPCEELKHLMLGARPTAAKKPA